MVRLTVNGKTYNVDADPAAGRRIALVAQRRARAGVMFRRLGGSPITQGHPTGYPIYRLEWQSLGSLQRRLRNCLAGVRAEAPPYGAPELVDRST